MSVRTYNPSVRVGNWNEDLCLEEDLLKDFLEKKEKGELLINKTHNLLSNILQKVELTRPKDGYLRFGDTISIYNPTCEVALSINMAGIKLHECETVEGPCSVSGSKMLQPCIKNAFKIVSCNGTNDGEYLMYGQHFMLCTMPNTGGNLSLQSERATFIKSAKKSRQQEVLLSEVQSFLSHWAIIYLDPQERLEMEGMPVACNEKVLINHCKTNQRLNALEEFTFRTPFGKEHEITANTCLNSHKVEQPSNQWVLVAESDTKKDETNLSKSN